MYWGCIFIKKRLWLQHVTATSTLNPVTGMNESVYSPHWNKLHWFLDCVDRLQLQGDTRTQTFFSLKQSQRPTCSVLLVHRARSIEHQNISSTAAQVCILGHTFYQLHISQTWNKKVDKGVIYTKSVSISNLSMLSAAKSLPCSPPHIASSRCGWIALRSKVDTTMQGWEPITTPVMPQGQITSPNHHHEEHSASAKTHVFSPYTMSPPHSWDDILQFKQMQTCVWYKLKSSRLIKSQHFNT